MNHALCLALAFSACSDSIDFAAMEKAEATARERASRELCAFMSIETMFPDSSSRTLAEAAASGNRGRIEKALQSGAAATARGHRNCTVLFWALQNYAGFEALLKAGADPNVVFDEGGSVMHWAARGTDERFLRAALAHGGDPNLVAGEMQMTPLFEALASREALEMLVEAGANINAQASTGDTPAMVAAGRGRFDLVYFLLERGANPRIPNNAGRTLADRVVDKERLMDPNHELSRWRERVAHRLAAEY
jgi:ankyrin repeat protein